MSTIARRLGFKGKKDSPNEKPPIAPRGGLNQGPQVNMTNDSSGSTQRPLSFTEDSMWSAPAAGASYEDSNTPNQHAYEESSEFQNAVDPNIAILSGVRHERVEDLSSRVTISSNHPSFEGGYSKVWIGKLDDSQVVAIKGLKDKQIRPAKAQRRFKREVGTWWCLRHENVIPLLGLIYNEEPFGSLGAMVSPWYKNGSAAAYLSNKERPVSITDRINLFYGVANGLHYLHTFDTSKIAEEPVSGLDNEPEDRVLGIVHGDLKPLNILVDDNGVAKLCDFGLLHLVRGSAPTGVTTTSRHTGTTRYLCYELVVEDDDQESDQQLVPTTASDVHALASVGLEFLYSTPPYADIYSRNRLDYAIQKAIENKIPPAVRPDDTSGVVSTLWDLFEECWSIKPRDRPDTQAICEYLRKNRGDLIVAMQ